MSSDAATALAANKAKTHRGRKILQSRLPQVHEDHKKCLFLKGTKTSQEVQDLLTDLYIMRKPDCLYLSKKNEQDAHPFENIDRIQHLCKIKNSSLFCLGSSSKKRPRRIIIGRTFDDNLLDMCEFDILEYTPSRSFNAGTKPPQINAKPLVVFQGTFDQTDKTQSVKSLLADFTVGPNANQVLLSGIDRLVVISSIESAEPSTEASNILELRQYQVLMKKSSSNDNLPRIELNEIGPFLKMKVDRQKVADPNIMKVAMMVPREEAPKKVKNVTTNALGEKRGRIHIDRQNLDKVYTPHNNYENKKKQKTVVEAEQ